jgi:hypothetical protein
MSTACYRGPRIGLLRQALLSGSFEADAYETTMVGREMVALEIEIDSYKERQVAKDYSQITVLSSLLQLYFRQGLFNHRHHA